MATHSSILAWRILWAEESGRLQSIGLQRVGHSLAAEQQQINKEASWLRHWLNYWSVEETPLSSLEVRRWAWKSQISITRLAPLTVRPTLRWSRDFTKVMSLVLQKTLLSLLSLRKFQEFWELCARKMMKTPRCVCVSIYIIISLFCFNWLFSLWECDFIYE